jgi:hypothetical protein
MALAPGCQRRAPGPEECHALAVQWERGVVTPAPHRHGARLPQASEGAIFERTTECLTTPYDRELTRCVVGGAPVGLCVRAFEMRHALPSSAPR